MLFECRYGVEFIPDLFDQPFDAVFEFDFEKIGFDLFFDCNRHFDRFFWKKTLDGLLGFHIEWIVEDDRDTQIIFGDWKCQITFKLC